MPALPEVHLAKLVMCACIVGNEIDALRERGNGRVVLLLRTGQCANRLIHAVETEQRLQSRRGRQLANRIGIETLALIHQAEFVSRAAGRGKRREQLLQCRSRGRKISADEHRVGQRETRALVARVQRDRGAERLRCCIELTIGEVYEPLDAMRFGAIGGQLYGDGDVLGSALERSVAEGRGCSSQRARFDATVDDEWIAHHALAEQVNRA